MHPLEPRITRNVAPGDNPIDDAAQAHGAQHEEDVHPLDGPEARKTLAKLLGWYYREREVQAFNRLQMAIDADFYDGEQWDAQDAAALKERGQAPLVFNEVAPMVDWLIGTERRSRVD